jgi:hypothetical protein
MISPSAQSTPSAAAAVVRGAVESFNRGDVDGYLACCDPGGPRWVAASGRTIDVPTCEVYAVDDDRRIRESWVYGDMLDIFRQIAPAAAVSA